MGIEKKNLMVALMVAMFLGAVEGTVVTTAIPTIARELNGFNIISMIFSSYLLTSAISTPIYGKLSDLYGRKKMLSIGIIIFILGSFLCGLSQNIYMLIFFRAIQGLGNGAILTITYTIVGDVFSVEERSKVQGSLSSVWGIASLIGPFLGGALIDSLSWHWIFFINIPFGIISIILLQRNLHEDFEKKKHKIDFGGIITLSAAMIVFLNIFLSSENRGDSKIIFIAASLVISIFIMIIFFMIERTAKEPIIPFEIFTRTSTIVNIAGLLISAVLIGMDVYIPIYMQNVLGFSATVSGLALISISVSWLIASVLLGKWILKYGEKKAVIISNLILIAGVGLLTTLDMNSSFFQVVSYIFITGLGFGGLITAYTIIIQESAEYSRRGVATSTHTLLKTLGQTIGVSVFGVIFNSNIVKYFKDININLVNPDDLYSSSAKLLSITGEQIKLSLSSSVNSIFIILTVVCCISIVLSMAIKEQKEQECE